MLSSIFFYNFSKCFLVFLPWLALKVLLHKLSTQETNYRYLLAIIDFLYVSR